MDCFLEYIPLPEPISPNSSHSVPHVAAIFELNVKVVWRRFRQAIALPAPEEKRKAEGRRIIDRSYQITREAGMI